MESFDNLKINTMRLMSVRLGVLPNEFWNNDEYVKKGFMLLAGYCQEPDWVEFAHLALL